MFLKFFKRLEENGVSRTCCADGERNSSRAVEKRLQPHFDLITNKLKGNGSLHMTVNKDKASLAKMGLYSPPSLEDPNYDPVRLLDSIKEKLNLKKDAALCRVLQVPAPVISKVRKKKVPIGAVVLIRMHEVSEISIRDLRELMSKPKPKE